MMMNGLNYVWYVKVLPMILATATPVPAVDPMRIIEKEDDQTRTRYVADHYGIAELFNVLKDGFIIVCICAVLISLIALLFVNKAEMVAEKKADVMHKLGIVFIISSLISILGIFGDFVKAVF